LRLTEMANRLPGRLFFKKYKKKIILDFFGMFQQMHEFSFFLDPLEIPERKRHESGAESLSSLSSSAIDHFAAALGFHARPEAMVLLSF
jgi:hypothetical protein